MARLTQRPQVSFIVGAAVFEWQDVMNLSCGSGAATLEAVLAQRVGSDVGVTDLPPAGTVTAVDLRVTLAPSVPFVLRFGMLRTEAGVGEVRAAGLGAGTGRLDRHHALPFTDIAKPQGSQPIAGFALGLFLLFNHLQYFSSGSRFPSQVSDTR